MVRLATPQCHHLNMRPVMIKLFSAAKYVQVSTRSAAATDAADGHQATEKPSGTPPADMAASKAAGQSDVSYLLIYNGILAVGWCEL